GTELRRLSRRILHVRSHGLRREEEPGERRAEPRRGRREQQLELRLGRRSRRSAGGSRPSKKAGEELLHPPSALERDAHVRDGRRILADAGGKQQPIQPGQRDDLARLGSDRRERGHPSLFQVDDCVSSSASYARARAFLARRRALVRRRWVAGSTFRVTQRAYYLDGKSQQDVDIYVMISAYWEPLRFTVEEQTGDRRAWKRAIDTSLESPLDIAEPRSELA